MCARWYTSLAKVVALTQAANGRAAFGGCVSTSVMIWKLRISNLRFHLLGTPWNIVAF